MRHGLEPMAERSVARRPAVPDWRRVTCAAAREALEGIVAAGCHGERFDRLGIEEAQVLAAVLHLYAEFGRPPSTAEIAESTGLSEPEADKVLAGLHRRDLLLRDGDGAISGAYPFTGSRTGHSVAFPGSGRRLNAMCAIDALGAGAMCRSDAIVQSACRACGSALVVATRKGGMALGDVRPEETVIWAGFTRSCGCAADSLCTQLIGFCSDRHLNEWCKSAAAGDGRRLTVAEAFQVAKALFADRALLGGD
jgi:mercuric reductase